LLISKNAEIEVKLAKIARSLRKIQKNPGGRLEDLEQFLLLALGLDLNGF
jgi:hypothetical protein